MCTNWTLPTGGLSNCTLVMFTGGDSLHFYWRIHGITYDDPPDLDEFSTKNHPAQLEDVPASATIDVLKP